MKSTVNFTQHYPDGHAEDIPTPVENAEYLIERNVSFHFRLDNCDDHEVFVMWTEHDGQRLAQVTVNPAEVGFPTAFAHLRDGTLDVLAQKET